MRAVTSTIQETLTAEAAALLNQAIGEAARRLHGQTTPLHVASALLSCPTGLLRQACVRSQSRVQCRGLELCFSVALERLPSSTPSNSDSSSSVTEPPISNALLAALKRAQAHQRRCCPEQQQQPILSGKVELDQLVLSILDDPSVSRVMREASFSSPLVKANIEQSISISSSSSSSNISVSQNPFLSLCHSSSAATSGKINPYRNPQFQLRPDDVERVLQIMARGQKRNPILVDDSDPRPILKEVLRRIECGADPLVPSSLRGAQVISLEKDFVETPRILARIRELGSSIEARGGEVGVVLDVGDLKCLVEGPGSVQQKKPFVASESARSAVLEMTKLLARFSGVSKRLWLVGLATCTTYLRCQVYHPSIEDDWDLQAASIAPRSWLPHPYTRLGANVILGTSKERLVPMRSFPAATSVLGVPISSFTQSLDGRDSSQKLSLCSLCTENYWRDLKKIVAMEFEESSSTSKKEYGHPLPSWLQRAKEQDHSQQKEHEMKSKKWSAELLMRWQETCSKFHPYSSAVQIDRRKPVAFSVSPPFSLPPKLNITGAIPTVEISFLEQTACPVKSDLALGQSKQFSPTMVDVQRDCVQDSSVWEQDKSDPRFSGLESFKRLFNGLTERVGWQPEAASAIATAIVQCKSGNGKPRPIGSKGAVWLLFDGFDKVGRLKMAAALSELMFGTTPITIQLTRASNSDTNFRGKTSMDWVADALFRNPFSVIVIEEINSVDNVAKSTLKSAMKTGRLLDSHGREISLQSAIFVLLTDDPSFTDFEVKILESARSGWLLEFVVLESVGKRQADWLCRDEQAVKRSRESQPGLSLDLNLAINTEDENEDPSEGSRNSSNLTAEHEQENEPKRLVVKKLTEPTVAPISWAAAELPLLVDEIILFQPVDLTSMKKKVAKLVRSKFNEIAGFEHLIRIEKDALEKILAVLWLAGAGFQCHGLEEWAEKMLVPGIQQLKTFLMASAGPVTVQLIAKKVKCDVSGHLMPAMVSAAPPAASKNEL